MRLWKAFEGMYDVPDGDRDRTSLVSLSFGLEYFLS